MRGDGRSCASGVVSPIRLDDMNTESPFPPALRPWVELGAMLVEVAGKGAIKALSDLRPRRHGSYRTRRPGAETPAWNVIAALLRAELKPLGAKVRLARYLGIPRQRLYDFLNRPSRLPDAELTLQLLYWLAEKRAGRDPSL